MTNPHGNPPKSTIDFETRSAADLLDVGAWRYSVDETTEVMCMFYRLPYWEEDRVEGWWPAYPELGIEEAPYPQELMNWIAGGGLVEAHNAFFERVIWLNVMVKRHGWPEVPHESWRCSAAKAAAHSLPRKLEMLCKALGVRQQKDEEGAKVMKKMSKPRKPRKAEVLEWLDTQGVLPLPAKKYRTRVGPSDHPGRFAVEVDVSPEETRTFVMPIFWLCTAEMLTGILFPYCAQDVRAEESASDALRDLSETETQVYLMDQRINQRGVQIDRVAVTTALDLVGDVFKELNAELVQITDGQILKATQRARILAWLNERGVGITNTQGPTIDEWLKRRDLDPHAYRVLELMRALGRSSTAKYSAFQDYADPADWRARGMLLYHGAGTGRWAGSGPQPHNFPRGDIKNMALAWDVIQTMDVGLIEAFYDDLMTALSHALRGAIIPGEGKKLVAADYAAIEARVIFWLADEQRALDIFRRGDCIYCDMASDIYGFQVIKGVHDAERQMGKQTILGLGFQMGWKKFIDTCAKYGIFLEPEFAQNVVNLYRKKYWRVAKMWSDQEKAAIEAVRSKRTIRCGRIQWRVVDRFLYCKLPSGRLLAYPDPIIGKKPLPWDASKLVDVLTFMGVDTYTKKWVRQETYGGTLVENIVQATARDLMADAMLRCEETGVYDVVLSVHDELIMEVPADQGSVKELEALMSQVPEWADGCPVKAEGWQGPRYKK